MPVPIAVAPMLISNMSAAFSLSRVWSKPRVDAKPWNSWPSVIGTASCSWVRPTLSTSWNSRALARNATRRWSSSSSIERSESDRPILIAVGYTSFVDWLRLVWSIGERNA